jgi:hypothetical protein
VQQRVGLHHLCLRARSREDVDRCAEHYHDSWATRSAGDGSHWTLPWREADSLSPTPELTPSPSATAPALVGEATADQAASCVEQPSVRPLNSHGDGFGKATSGILIAALGARYAASPRRTAACSEEAE